MRFLKLLSIILISFGFFNTNSFAANCYKTKELDEKAKLRMKAEILCMQSADSCHEVFFAHTAQTQQKNYICESSDIEVASLIPISPLVFGVRKLAEPLTNSAHRKYVNSVMDFYHHTELHIKRVGAMAEALYKKFPERFPGLSLEQLKFAISLHDIEKINPSILSKNGVPFIQELYQYYGGIKPPQDLVDDLNAAGKKHMRAKLIEAGFTEQALKSLELAESIPDFTDRAMNPVSSEEFKREMWKESTGRKAQNSKSYKEMALYLEREYNKIIPEKLMYAKLTKVEANRIFQKIFIDSNLAKYKNAGTPLRSNLKYIGPIMARSLQSRLPEARTIKNLARVGGNILLYGSGIVDGLLLATYSSATGCSSLGYHEWVVKGGKCTPVPGYSDVFVKNMLDKDFENNSIVTPSSNSCEVFKHNDEINQKSLFAKNHCRTGGVDLYVDDEKSVFVDYDYKGKIKALKLSEKFNNLFDRTIYNYRVSKLKYNDEGGASEVCTQPRKFLGVKGEAVKERCIKDPKHIPEDVMDEIRSLNYKIYQSISCCEGNKNTFNNHVACPI